MLRTCSIRLLTSLLLALTASISISISTPAQTPQAQARSAAAVLPLRLETAPNFEPNSAPSFHPSFAPTSARIPSPPRRPLPVPDPLPYRPPPPLQPFPTPPGGIGLVQIGNAAGTIFSGRVVSIARVPASAGPVKTVAITFHVERALRGASTGQDFTIFQWIGLWTSGQRYRVGERVLLFLYPPSKLGLTSSVGGPMGRFALDEFGRVVLSPQHLAAFGADPVLGGRSLISFRDFARAVLQARGEE
jgi:hypothetical protein